MGLFVNHQEPCLTETMVVKTTLVPGDTFTELCLRGGRGAPSRAFSTCGGLSNNLTLPTGAVYIDGGAGLVSTERCGHPDRTGEATKQSASGTETSALVPLVEVTREFIKTSASSEINEDMLVTRLFTWSGR
ncbi:hypothetical protein L873DRAFT_367556 [Choiromyces venosus 120613-1]|uniref:Uncharacterized protein n=1 Tax=Choiromyces venosus 120613-1 TaxID=1336337 RepID=A0A3N4JWT7_9PEZI|nr:hypothetical protein L873DRAFT_367556 [Choiromyces venosus 120613-1]